MKENTIATHFDPNEYAISVQSTKIGINENKAIHSMLWPCSGNKWLEKELNISIYLNLSLF